MKKIHTLRALAGVTLAAAPFVAPALNASAADAVVESCLPVIKGLESTTAVKSGLKLSQLLLPTETDTTFNYLTTIPRDAAIREHAADWKTYETKMEEIQLKAKVIQKYVQNAMLSNTACSTAVNNYVNTNGFNASKPRVQVVPANLAAIVTNWKEDNFTDGWAATFGVADNNYVITLYGSDGNPAESVTKAFTVTENTGSTTDKNIHKALIEKTEWTPAYGFTGVRNKMRGSTTVATSLFESLGFQKFFAQYNTVMQLSADLNRDSEMVGDPTQPDSVFFTPVIERNIFINGAYYGVLGQKNATLNRPVYRKLANTPILISSNNAKQEAADQIQFIRDTATKFLPTGFSLVNVEAYTNEGSATGGLATGSVTSVTMATDVANAVKSDLGASELKLSQPYKVTYRTTTGTTESMPVWIGNVDDNTYRSYVASYIGEKNFLKDETTRIEAYSLSMVAGDTLKIELLTETQKTKMQDLTKNIGAYVDGYNISVVNGATNKTSFNQGITIRIPVDSKYKNNTMKAVHFTTNGDALTVDKQIVANVISSNGSYYAEFTTNELSPYAIVSTGIKQDDKNEDDKKDDNNDNPANVPNAPASGFMNMGATSYLAIAAFVAAAIASPFAYKRFHHKKISFKK